MLFLLSPAKSLDYETPAHVATHTRPRFVDEAAELIGVLREKSPAEIAQLMSLSDALATLNVGRYAAWSPRFTQGNSKQAVLAFNGDVYEGLDARTLSAEQLDWAQRHVVILSGLYGVLRPLDRMQPYRLEMGTRLATPHGKDLYAYWGSRIAEHLNERLRAGAGAPQAGPMSPRGAGHPPRGRGCEADALPVVVNLASEEYFKAVDRKALKARVVQCVFQDWKGGAWKIISFHAKRARGLMARHAIETRALLPEQLQGFDREGYAFDKSASERDRLVFRRREQP